MHFDDRLGTVLRLRADGEAVRKIQYRQLLDLLGTTPAEARGEQLDAAYARLAELGESIPVGQRAAMLRDGALRLRSPRLVAALAAGGETVAAAALQRAQLDPEQWLDLIPALPPAARGGLLARRDLSGEVTALLSRLGVSSRGLPPAAAEAIATAPAPALVPELDDLLRPAPGGEAIGAIVKRIEAYRRQQQVVEPAPAHDSPRLPLGEEPGPDSAIRPRAFDFATDAEGRITWSDPGVAPMVTGMRLGETATPELSQAMHHKQPLRARQLTIRGARAVAGVWQIDAGPWFDPLTGRFIGYRGRMRRPADETASAPASAPISDSPADRIRQMLHELRTPVNAIQGFAEVIQQQLFGPTPHEYRALAAGIAGDAARMLSAFEELERLAKLDSGAAELDSGECDLAATIQATVAQLAAHTTQRGSGFAVKAELDALPVPLARIECERIAWRLLATLAGVSAPGEMLKLRLREKHGMARIDLTLPERLATLDGDALFETGAGAVPQVIAAGVFGVGFALRLARAEARAAGGALERRDDRLRLTLPLLAAAYPAQAETA